MMLEKRPFEMRSAFEDPISREAKTALIEKRIGGKRGS